MSDIPKFTELTEGEIVCAQTREAVFDLTSRQDDGGIPVVVSSDAPVRMPDGIEILVHSREAIDLSRSPLPITTEHFSRALNVGIVDSLTVENGKLRGIARFGTRAEAAGYRDDVINGTIRSVSVGYIRREGYRRKTDAALITTQWTPSHAAMVAEPADVNAGFYRSKFTPKQEDDLQVVEVVRHNEQVSTNERAVQTAAAAALPGVNMTEVVAAPAADPKAAPVVPVQVNQGPSAAEMDKDRRLGIDNMCGFAQIGEDIANRWKQAGTSLKDVSDQIMAIQVERQKDVKPITTIGLTRSETETFSIRRAIQAVADKDWTKAGFEARASEEVAKRLGRFPEPNKFFVPYEVQERPMQQRDLTVGTTTAGGFLVQTTNVGFVELLRNTTVVFNMGARRLSGLQGSVAIPKQTVAATPIWLANEASTITESQQTFAQIALSPKNVGGYTEISRQLLLQSNPSAESLVMQDLAQVVAIDIDLKALNGSGASGQPTGIINTAGIGGVTGTSIAYAGVVEFQTDVFAGNTLTSQCGYVATGVVAGLLKQRVKFTNTYSPLWEGPLQAGSVDGYRAMSSNQVPTGDLLFGDFTQVIIAEWGVLEVEVNPYANFQAGIIGVRAMASIDVGLRYPAAFSLATSVT